MVQRDIVQFVVLSEGLQPRVAHDDQLSIHRLTDRITRVELRMGFMQQVDIPSSLQRLRNAGLLLDESTMVDAYSTRAVPHPGRGMAMWRKHLFAFMLRNSTDPVRSFGMDSDKLIEFTDVVRI